jgi:hypothetical protein
MATTRDQFLGSVPKTEWSDRERRKVAKLDRDGNPVLTRELDEVSRHNLLQHARTRAVGSALRKMLGLNNLTWEDLAQWGHNPDASASVSYGKGEDGGEAPTGDAKLKAKLFDLVKRKATDWKQIGALQKELGLGAGKALELADADLARLIEEIEKKGAQ